MPPTVAVAAFVFGAILAFIALLGGGFELFGAKVAGSVPKPTRIAAGFLGAVLMVVGLTNPFDRSSSASPSSPPSQLAATANLIAVGSQPTVPQVATMVPSPTREPPTPTLMPSPSPTQTQTRTPEPPTRTPVPPTEAPTSPPTPVPTPTPPADTPPDTILAEEETWRQGGAELTLKNAQLNASQYTAYSHWQGLAFELHFTNRKPQDISIGYSTDNIKATDNRGKSLPVIFYILNVGDTSCSPQTRIVRTDETVKLACNTDFFLADFDLGNQNITEITITVSGISSIQKARWRIPVSH